MVEGRDSRNARGLGIGVEQDSAVVLIPEDGGEVFASAVDLGLGHLGEGQVDLLMAKDFELPLGPEAGVNLDETFADGGLTPGSLPA